MVSRNILEQLSEMDDAAFEQFIQQSQPKQDKEVFAYAKPKTNKPKRSRKKSTSKNAAPVQETTSTEHYSENSDSLISIQLSDEFDVELFSEDVEENPRKYLKVPVAVLGQWKHPVYGDLEFTQTDFDQIQENFSNQITGYEPPLFRGHPVDRDTMEGAPAVAFLEDLDQEEDVLFGYWEVVDDSAYDQVKSRQFQYSSAEIIREAVSKESGESVGTVLVGTALTNRPFLTRMPRSTALSDRNVDYTERLSDSTELHTSFLFSLGQTGKPTPDMPKPENLNSESETLKETSPVVSSASPQVLSQQDVTQLLALAERVELAESKANKAESLLKERLFSEKIERVNKLNLSQSTKDWAVELLSAGGLSEENEQSYIDGLVKLSEENSALLLEQKGSTEETDKVNNPDQHQINPFQEVIDRNKKLSEQIEAKRTQRLANISVY
ncbi:hypothetical protein ACQ4M3_19060 [Leptolyngbya sp. AN03gr2]|uniref:hypothetical protein n=1 Tax=Leptolyngbya sp. AN03gr2 TaxID=3423364 RepID=UPI003D323773